MHFCATPKRVEFKTLNLVLSGRIISKMLLMNEEPCLVGTGDLAIGAADAEVVVDCHDAVRALARCCCWTNMHARWIGTVLTTDRNEYTADVWISARLDIENLAPLHCR